jgi:Autographiviridae endonuclease VII
VGKSVKTCYRCHRRLDRDEFHLDRTTLDGMDSKCKQCSSVLRAKRRGNKISSQGFNYNKLLDEQGNSCAICKTTTPSKDPRKSRFCLDHDHQTGQIRGLLCTDCNRALGLFKDDSSLLKRALEYLMKIRCQDSEDFPLFSSR